MAPTTDTTTSNSSSAKGQGSYVRLHPLDAQPTLVGVAPAHLQQFGGEVGCHDAGSGLGGRQRGVSGACRDVENAIACGAVMSSADTMVGPRSAISSVAMFG